MAAAGNTASFVVTGVFDSKTLIDTLDAALRDMDAKLKAYAQKASKTTSGAITQAVSQGTSTASKNAAKGTNALGSSASRVNKQFAEMGEGLRDINADLFTAVRRVVLWGLASRAVFNTFGQIGQSVKDIIDLNKTLVNIQKIRPVGFETSAIESNILSSAEKYGIVFREIAETQRTFFQQGFTTEQVLKLTNTQLLAVTASGLTAQESIELLISSMSVFNIEAERSISIIDKLQAVQANYAISTQDIATALRRVGPVVEQFSGDIDEVIGVITSLKESTRKSGEFIGTALSTIFSRIFTGVGANQLASIGIYINETSQQFKPLTKILRETAERWETLSEQERIATAFALGARRRYAQVIALFNNYSTVLRAAETSSSAFGAAIAAQQIEVTSVSRQFDILRNKVATTGMALLEALTGATDFKVALKQIAVTLQNFTDDVKNSAEEIASFVNGVKGVAVGLIGWTIGVSVARRLFATFASIGKILLVVRNFGAVLAGTKIAFLGAGAAAGTAAVSFNALTIAASGVLGVLGIIASLYAVTKLTTKVMSAQKDEADDLFLTYTNLKSATERNTEVLREYQAVAEQFKDFGGVTAYGEFIRGIDKSGNPVKSIVDGLRGLDGVAEDLNNITLDQFVAELERVRGKGASLETALGDIQTLLGFETATKQGMSRELEKIKESASAVVSTLGQITPALDHLAAADASLIDVQRSFSVLTGISFNQLNKELEGFSGKISALNLAGLSTQASGEIKKFQDAIYNSITKTSIIGTALESDNAEIRAKAEEIAKYFIDNLFVAVGGEIKTRDMLGSLSRKYGGQPATMVEMPLDFQFELVKSPQQIQKEITESLRTLIDPDKQQAEIDNLLKDSISFYKFLGGDLSSTELRKLSKDTQEFFLGTTKRVELSTKELEENEVIWRKIIELIKNSGGPGILPPKKIISEYTAIAKYTAGLNDLKQQFELTSASASFFGKSVADTQIANLRKDIEQGLSTISGVEGIADQISAKEKYIAILTEEVEAINDVNGRAKYESEVRGELAARIVGEQTDLAELIALQKSSLALSDEKVKALRQEMIAYNEYESAINSIKQSYDLQNAVVKESYTETIAIIEKYKEFNNKVSEIASSFSKLAAGNNLLKQYSSELKLLTAKYTQEQVFLIDKRDLLEDHIAKQKRLALEEDAAIQSKAQYTELELKFSDLNAKILKDTQKRLNTLDKELLVGEQQIAQAELLANQEYVRSVALLRMNTALDYQKNIYGEITNLASGYADAVLSVADNIETIVSERGSLRNIIGPISDAYISAIKTKAQQALTEAFENISRKQIEGLGGTLLSPEEQLNYTVTLAAYENGAEYTYRRIVDAFTVSTEYFISSLGLTQQQSGVYGPPAPAVVKEQSSGPIDTNSPGVESAVTKGMLDLNQRLTYGNIITDKQFLADLEANRKRSQTNALLQYLGNTMGRLASGMLGGNAQNSAFGASLGTLAGTAINAANPLYGMVGGLLGGLVGGLFGGGDEDEKKERPTPAIYRANTDALRQNTQALIQNSQSFAFLEKLINAPSNFRIPAYSQLGGGMQVVVVGSSESDPEKAAYDGLSKVYKNNYRRIGRRG